MSRCKPWDALATLLSPHALSPGGSWLLQAVVTLSACHVLQNNPQFIVQSFDVCTPQKPILGADEVQKVPLQPLLSCLGLWGRNWVCWKTNFWSLKKVMLRCFTTPCSMSSWYTRTPVSPLPCKNEDVSPLDGTLPTKPWCRKGDGLPAPSERTSRDIWA